MKTRRWDLIHKFEDDNRRRYLKRLSAEESFNIMDGLYQFAVMNNRGMVRYAVTKDRIRFLIKERARFKKITI